ncbi:hypothetical protein CK203_103889 [Vitis vinifera]|uniref:Uncharacterized protein n=1 Tax=Vitis vinifera TaxID=29760 RepID=A0A438E4X4_VITVI|nr:hypothetical protein CK203_103889 [Vitis vinifera]
MSDSLLEKYKGFNARLPVIVAETLLRTDPQIELPLWLVHMFKVGTPLLSYLGLPLGAPYKSDSMGWGRGENLAKLHGQPAQPVGEPVNRLTLSYREPVEECQKHSLSSSSLLFLVEVHILPGRGPVKATRVKFWKGKWCGDVALCTSYPALYSIVYSKEDWVVNVWHSTIEGGCWATSFIRAINDWELDLVERFLLSLQGRTVCRDQEDKVI